MTDTKQRLEELKAKLAKSKADFDAMLAKIREQKDPKEQS